MNVIFLTNAITVLPIMHYITTHTYHSM